MLDFDDDASNALLEDVPVKGKIGKNRKRLKRKATKELARTLKQTEFDDFVEFASNSSQPPLNSSFGDSEIIDNVISDKYSRV
ncbi:hypothetical protein JTE90_028245 [Oedothorax gibbosus]|uniref:Uncharacterized protein n=1 Tax=Oedothorax gibbosus TaxID=931172 RepID=A0AAV6US79_9ARAC|nr:hypothetical protein JTE90_028245 [Oedothorax gibbosus]